MPSSRSVRFLPRARRDVQAILQHSVRTWGEDQGRTYRGLLEDAFRRVGEYPLLGRQRDEARPGVRVLGVGEHVILYRLEGEAVAILRVVHAHRDLSRLSLP